MDLIEQKNNTIFKLIQILDKLFLVLEDFRRNLNDFQKSCNCSKNLRNRQNFSELDISYKTVVEEYYENKSKIKEELRLSCDNKYLLFSFNSCFIFRSSSEDLET